MAETFGGPVRPDELGEKDDLHPERLALGDRFPQLLGPAQKGVGIMAGFVLVLAAVVPTHQLNGAHACVGRAHEALTGRADVRHDVAAPIEPLALGRVHLHLLPGMGLGRPRGRRGGPHPGAPARPVYGRTVVPIANVELQPDAG